MKQRSRGNSMTVDAKIESGPAGSNEDEESDSSSEGDSHSDEDDVIYDDDCGDEDEGESDDDSEDMESDGHEDDVIVPNVDQQVNVEFEAFPPSDGDFQSLVALLGRLFYKEQQINLAELANWVIGHNYIGSVLKTNNPHSPMDTSDEDDEDDDDEDEEDEDDTVYGVTTVVNLKPTGKSKDESFKHSIVAYLTEKCNSPEINTILNSPSSHTVGLLLTERFVNIPPLLAPPMLKCLCKEIDSAKLKKMPYDFTHILLISKSYDQSVQSKNGSSNEGLPPCLEFINPEDEIFQQYAQCVASFPVPEAEHLVGGSWGPKEKSMPQYRTVSLMPMDKFKGAVNQISNIFTVENMMSLMNANGTATT